MSDVRGLALSVLLPGFEGIDVPAWLERLLGQGLAGVCLFGQNVADDDQLTALTGRLHGLRPGVLVASDEEGGTVTRVENATGSSWPGHATLGALDDLHATHAVAAGLARRLRAVGVDVAFAPVADVNSEPDNPVIGVRSFGATPDLVARHVAAFVTGVQQQGVAACAKHFPGHGATRTDSHLELPYVDAPLDVVERRDLPPFAAAVEAGVRCVMTAHVVLPALDDRPGTVSPPVLRLLRERSGFDGVVVSDALDMAAMNQVGGRGAAAVAALAAGVDLLCVGNPAHPTRYDSEDAVEEIVLAVEKAVANGELSVARLEQAAARVAALGAWAATQRRTPPPAPAPVHGRGIAARALRVTGDVRLGTSAAVVVPQPEIGLAAGRRESTLATLLRDRRPDWPVHEVSDPDAVHELFEGLTGVDVVVLLEGRIDPSLAMALAFVLDDRPDIVLVDGRPPSPNYPSRRRRVQTFGGGRAVAEAVADLLLGKEVAG